MIGLSLEQAEEHDLDRDVETDDSVQRGGGAVREVASVADPEAGDPRKRREDRPGWTLSVPVAAR